MDGKNLSNEDMISFTKLMAVGDVGNSHAFGYFNRNGVFKKKGKFNYTALNEGSIISSSFIVGHNRYATPIFEHKPKKKKESDSPFHISQRIPGSILLNLFFAVFNWSFPEPNFGVKKALNSADNHPFFLGDFVMVHNGVIENYNELKKKYGLRGRINTDSFLILYMINLFLKQDSEKDREKRIINSIKRTTNELKGTWSVFLYDRLLDKLYYFRNSKKPFFFKKIKGDLLVGTTNKKNLEYVFKFEKGKVFKPKPNYIYGIDEKGIHNIKMKGGKK